MLTSARLYPTEGGGMSFHAIGLVLNGRHARQSVRLWSPR